MSKIAKWIAIFSGGFLLAILTVLLSVRLYVTTDHARHMVQTLVNASIPGRFSWDNLSISVFSGCIEFENILFEGQAGDKIISLDRAFLNLSWHSLIKGVLKAEIISLDKPVVLLAEDADGNLNLMTALGISPVEKTESFSGSPDSSVFFNSIVDECFITAGVFQYKTPGKKSENKPESVSVQDINITFLNGDLLKQSGRISAQTAKVEIDMADIQTAVESINIAGDLSRGGLDSFLFKLRSGTGDIDASGAIEKLFDSPILDLDLNLKSSLSEIRKLFLITTDLTGALELHARVMGRIDNPEVLASLNFKDGNIAGNKVDQISVQGSLKDRIVKLLDLKADTPMGKLAATGGADLRKAFQHGFFSHSPDPDNISWHLSLNQKDTLLERLIVDTGIKGSCNSSLVLEGQGTSYDSLSVKAVFKLFAEKFAVDKVLLPLDTDLLVKATFEKNKVVVQQLDLNRGSARFSVSGDYDFSADHLQSDFLVNLPEPLTFGFDSSLGRLKGNLVLSGSTSGSFRNPEISLGLEGRSLVYEDIILGNLDLGMRFANGIIYYDHARLIKGKSSVDLAGTMQVMTPGSVINVKEPVFDLTLKSTDLFLEDFLKGMKGKFKIDAYLGGTISSLRGSADLEGEKISMGGQAIDSLSIKTRLVDEQLHLDSFVVGIAPGNEITARGWISPFRRDYDLSVVSNGIFLKNINLIQDRIRGQEAVSLNLAGSGHFENPCFAGTIKLNHFKLNNAAVEDISLKVDLRDSIARISGELNCKLNAMINIETLDFSAKAVFEKTDLATVFELGGWDDLSGMLSGTLSAEGNAGAPDMVSLFAGISSLEIVQNNLTLVRADDVTASFENKSVSIPGIRFNLPDEGYIDIKGVGSTSGPLDFQADGSLPLSLIRLVAEDFQDISGDVTFHGHLAGSYDNPDGKMTIHLNNIGLSLPELNEKFHTINGQILATPQAINLDFLRGELGTGHFELSGKMNLKEMKANDFAFKINAHALPLNIPETLDLLLNSDLVLSGTPERSIIKGDITILDGQYYKDLTLTLPGNIGLNTRTFAPIPPEKSESFFSKPALDIRVKHRSSFEIDNNIALLLIKPDLRIYGSMGNPLISGRAEVESGIISYLGKEFEVKKGVVDFLNPYKIEPTIALDGQTVIRKWIIFLTVSGTPDNLKFSLTSTPHEVDGDILSLLAFGKTTSELMKSEGSSSVSTTQLLADLVATTLQKNIKETTGLDSFEIKYKQKTESEVSDEVAITVGKELSRRISVRYTVETKDGEAVQRTVTEYKFLENLMINAFQNTKGDFGGELMFRLGFR